QPTPEALLRRRSEQSERRRDSSLRLPPEGAQPTPEALLRRRSERSEGSAKRRDSSLRLHPEGVQPTPEALLRRRSERSEGSAKRRDSSLRLHPEGVQPTPEALLRRRCERSERRAEEEGFEPPVTSPPQRISSPPPSTARPLPRRPQSSGPRRTCQAARPRPAVPWRHRPVPRLHQRGPGSPVHGLTRARAQQGPSLQQSP